MAKTRTQIEQEIENEKAKIEKLKKQLKAREKAENEKMRKERTRRLIQIGGVVEKYVGEITDLAEFEKYINQYSSAIKNTQVKKSELNTYF